jgi:hypothetical protein
MPPTWSLAGEHCDGPGYEQIKVGNAEKTRRRAIELLALLRKSEDERALAGGQRDAAQCLI